MLQDTLQNVLCFGSGIGWALSSDRRPPRACERAEQFQHFMATQGRLFHSLELELPDPFAARRRVMHEYAMEENALADGWGNWGLGRDDKDDAAEAAADCYTDLAHAAATATAAAPALRRATRLQHLQLNLPEPLLLASIGSRHLTSMTLGLPEASGEASWGTAVSREGILGGVQLLMHQTVAALAQLTTLRRLEFERRWVSGAYVCSCSTC